MISRCFRLVTLKRKEKLSLKPSAGWYASKYAPRYVSYNIEYEIGETSSWTGEGEYWEGQNNDEELCT